MLVFYKSNNVTRFLFCRVEAELVEKAMVHNHWERRRQHPEALDSCNVCRWHDSGGINTFCSEKDDCRYKGQVGRTRSKAQCGQVQSSDKRYNITYSYNNPRRGDASSIFTGGLPGARHNVYIAWENLQGIGDENSSGMGQVSLTVAIIEEAGHKWGEEVATLWHGSDADCFMVLRVMAAHAYRKEETPGGAEWNVEAYRRPQAQTWWGVGRLVEEIYSRNL